MYYNELKKYDEEKRKDIRKITCEPSSKSARSNNINESKQIDVCVARYRYDPLHEVNDMPLNGVCVYVYVPHSKWPIFLSCQQIYLQITLLMDFFSALFGSRQQSDNRSDKFVVSLFFFFLNDWHVMLLLLIAYCGICILLRQREHQNRLLLKQLEMYTQDNIKEQCFHFIHAIHT